MEKKNTAGKISFYLIISMSFCRNIASKNCSSDESLTDIIFKTTRRFRKFEDEPQYDTVIKFQGFRS